MTQSQSVRLLRINKKINVKCLSKLFSLLYYVKSLIRKIGRKHKIMKDPLLLRANPVCRTQLEEFNGHEQSHKLLDVRATHWFMELLVAMQLIRAD